MSTDVTAEEYLEHQRTTDPHRSEWIDGEVREMTGARRNHNKLSTRLARLLDVALDDLPFEVYSSDMKIRIPGGSAYYYPDVAVAPDPPELLDDHGDVVLDPVVVIEVLSPSTEHVDRGRKLDDYRSIPSLRHYLLFDQNEVRIDHYARVEDGWLLTTSTDREDVVSLPVIDGELRLGDVYRRVL